MVRLRIGILGEQGDSEYLTDKGGYTCDAVKRNATPVEKTCNKVVSLEKLKTYLSELLGKNADLVKSVKISPVENSTRNSGFSLYYWIRLYGETGNKLGEVSLTTEELEKCVSQTSIHLHFNDDIYISILSTKVFLPADQYGYCDDKEEVKRLLTLYNVSEDTISKAMKFWKDDKTVARIEYE